MTAATESAGRRFDNEVADLYATLGRLERKLDHLRSSALDRFDRIESRLTTGLAERTEPDDDATAMESLLAGIRTHLSGLDEDLDGLGKHLAGLDAHLEQMDSGFTVALRRSAAGS